MYAVIRTGGKQYRVEPGQQLRVERLPGAVGDTVELTDVLLLAGDAGVTVGTPGVAKATVVAEIAGQERDRKIRVFKYKSKIRYRRLRGHRQLRTVLAIKEIMGPGIAKRRRRREREKAEPTQTDVESASATTETPAAPERVTEEAPPERPEAVEVPEAVEETPKPRRARKAATKAAAPRSSKPKSTPATKAAAKKRSGTSARKKSTSVKKATPADGSRRAPATRRRAAKKSTED